MPEFSDHDLDGFAKAIQTLKLYRRAELESPQGEDLIEKLYVDPLPHDHVHNLLREPNTTFLIGRKGTGKSTVFLRAQKSLLKEPNVLSSYVDIKTVFESAHVDTGLASNLAKLEGALPETAVARLMLMTAFLRAVVVGIRDDLDRQLRSSRKRKIKEAFTGSYDELARRLNDYVDDLARPEFVNVQGIRNPSFRALERDESAGTIEARASLDAGATPGLHLGGQVTESHLAESEQQYSDILLRAIDIRTLIAALKALLHPLGIRHLYVFLDDFSELPQHAMEVVVDTLVAPLNNWSEELVKFKVAAYPGRIHFGTLDKSKIDEISLDLHSIYGQSSVADMEVKGVEFTTRLVERRLHYFGLDVHRYIDGRQQSAVWTALFHASMGNPRTLGYILFFTYENQLLYGRMISTSGIRDAAKKYYEDKLEPYFAMGRFLHESFAERSTIYSLKELLEKVVERARTLRSKDAASVFRQIEGPHPTSHFNIDQRFDSLLSTLELNFFVTKYYVMSNRDGHRVSVYALNYGLCEKYSIPFGRPAETRQQRVYFVERVFDYNSLLQDFIASHQEIKCNKCGAVVDAKDIEALKRFNMLCPECHDGTCEVTNISRKYEDVIRSVDSQQLLPSTELGILQTLHSEPKAMYAGDIAGEMDVSYQLVGKRAKRLSEQDLVVREMVNGRREFTLSDAANRIYFDSERTGSSELDLPAEGSDLTRD